MTAWLTCWAQVKEVPAGGVSGQEEQPPELLPEDGGDEGAGAEEPDEPDEPDELDDDELPDAPVPVPCSPMPFISEWPATAFAWHAAARQSSQG